MVCQVGAGAVSSEEALGEIGEFREEGSAVVVEVFEDVETVVVLTRIAMFGGEAIVDGDDDGGNLASELAADGVVGEGGGVEEGEAAAVEEDDDGEGLGLGL